MKKLILFLLLIGISGTLEAAEYIVEQPDGSIAILYYKESSRKGLPQVIADSGFTGLKIKKVNDPSIYPKDKTDRKYWRLDEFDPKNPKIVIDTVAKDADLAAKAAKETAKSDILRKLNITDAELKTLLGQ